MLGFGLAAAGQAALAGWADHRYAELLDLRNAAAAELDQAHEAARAEHRVEEFQGDAVERCFWLEKLDGDLAAYASQSGRSYMAPMAGRICRHGREMGV